MARPKRRFFICLQEPCYAARFLDVNMNWRSSAQVDLQPSKRMARRAEPRLLRAFMNNSIQRQLRSCFGLAAKRIQNGPGVLGGNCEDEILVRDNPAHDAP